MRMDRVGFLWERGVMGNVRQVETDTAVANVVHDRSETPSATGLRVPGPNAC